MLVDKIKGTLSNQFIQNMGWLGAAELINRVLRLGTTVVVARMLNSYDYGLVAIVLTVNEFSMVLTMRSGIGSKLVQAQEADLETLCNTAYWITWIFSIAMFFLQCAIAVPISWFYGDSQVILPICAIALTYLMMPIYSIQGGLIFRENRLKVLAICNGLQALIGNLLTIIFALLGFKMWAIVLPVILTMPIWIIVCLRNHSWRPTQSFSLYKWREIVRFSTDILGVELLNKLRANLDYLIIGHAIGVDALGIYYFAFNAGLGISLNLIQSFTWSLFPYLCESRENHREFRNRYLNSLKILARFFIPIVLLQSTLAPFYVPIIFGQKWINAIPILIVICLSALPRPFADSASILLNSVDKSRLNLIWNLIFTTLFAAALIVSVQWGIFSIALAVLISHLLAMPAFTVWATQFVFGKRIRLPS